MQLLRDVMTDILTVGTIGLFEPDREVGCGERAVGVADQELRLLLALKRKYQNDTSVSRTVSEKSQVGTVGMGDKIWLVDELIAHKLSSFGISGSDCVGYRRGWRIVVVVETNVNCASNDLDTVYF